MKQDIIQGDALTVLAGLPSESVQCVVTSPPYWGLRDYGTASWAGGDPACDHKAPARGGVSPSASGKQLTNAGTLFYQHAHACPCGAIRVDSQMGLEQTPAEYVERMVCVFRELRRVLRNNGTLWLNLGDSYATGAGRAFSPGGGKQGERYRAMGAQVPDTKNPRSGIPIFQPNRMPIDGLKPKDLVGIPWRVAFALQADGWWLRSDIIWSKPNPMPESIRDRPTKAHEYLFLLTKSARYYYNADAISEPFADKRMGNPGVYDAALSRLETPAGVHGNGVIGKGWNTDGKQTARNARTVWTIATSPYPEAHFATFPTELPRRCILTGTNPGDTVLDPFCGAGTTLLVADRLGRHGIGIELNPQYVEMARVRITSDAPLLADRVLAEGEK